MLRRSTGYFNQQRLHGQPTQHVSQQSSKQSHGQLKSQPIKVNAAQKSQRRAAAIKSTQLHFRSTFDLDFCAKMYGLLRSNSPPNFSLIGPCVDQSQRWSNFPRNPNCRKFAAVNFVLFAVDFVLLLTWEMTLLLRCSYNQRRRCVEMI